MGASVCGLLVSACASAPTAGDRLGWMLGRWQDASVPGLVTEERWERLPDGDLLGLGRVLVDGRLGFAESLAITIVGGEPVYTAWPAGQEPVSFPASRVAEVEVVFANASHDFPREITYRRTPEGLEAVAVGVDDDGQQRVEKWSLAPVVGGPQETP